jgi:hypothetical protein
VDPLPTVSSCTLDERGTHEQLQRYGLVGKGAVVRERSRRRLIINVAEDVDRTCVEQLLAVEEECCPFFRIAWNPATRTLAVCVSRAEDEPALGAIAFALGLRRLPS